MSVYILLTLGMLITESFLSHVTQSDGAFAAGVDELIAAVWVELGRSDNLC